MQKLIQFLIKHSAWLLLFIYTMIGFVLLIRDNAYQRSVYLGSSNKLVGDVYTLSGNVRSYFYLNEINKELLEKNSYLEMQVMQLREELRAATAPELSKDSSHNSLFQRYNYITAQVINNSVNQVQNYITLNKGRLDGIMPEMGVVDQNGVIGKISSVSDHYSRVISLLNPKLRLSAKIKGGHSFGSAVWDGTDAEEAILEELPRHVAYKKGDTLITSGFSAVFPEGIMIGTIMEARNPKNNTSEPIKIRLSSKFSRLNHVRVISNRLLREQQNLESKSQ